MTLSSYIGAARAADLIPNGTLPADPNAVPAELANRAAALLLNAAEIAAVVALLYAAYALVTSVGSPDGITKLKKSLAYVGTGIFLLVFTSILFNFLTGLFKKIAG